MFNIQVPNEAERRKKKGYLKSQKNLGNWVLDKTYAKLDLNRLICVVKIRTKIFQT